MRHSLQKSEWLCVRSKCLFKLPLDGIYKREHRDLMKEMSLRVFETANELWIGLSGLYQFLYPRIPRTCRY